MSNEGEERNQLSPLGGWNSEDEVVRWLEGDVEKPFDDGTLRKDVAIAATVGVGNYALVSGGDNDKILTKAEELLNRFNPPTKGHKWRWR